jgi:hypothetical protein
MAATAAEIARLRRMVAEPTTTNGYTDTVLSDAIERYPVPDSAGVYPTDEDGVAESAWVATYDLNAAAADVWMEKAGALAATYDFSADGADFKRSQAAKQAREMAGYYRSRRYARGVLLKAEINSDLESQIWIGNLPEPD